MADDSPLPPLPGTIIRPEVRQYILACKNVLTGGEDAYQQFNDASVQLQRGSGTYNNEELTLVQDMYWQVCDWMEKEKGRKNSHPT